MVGSFVAAALSIIGISTTRFYPAIIGFLLRCKNRFMKNKNLNYLFVHCCRLEFISNRDLKTLVTTTYQNQTTLLPGKINILLNSTLRPTQEI
jgi:hypothetical protein